MKKEEKVRIIKWYISNKCGLGKIQTEKDNIDDLKTLEKLTMNDRAYPHFSNCCSCWYGDKDYSEKCVSCSEGSKYVFPYGYWKKFCEKE
jgi:hypothetical protein